MIAIMSAMQEEVQALLQNLKNIAPVTKGMRTYYKGILFNKPVVIVFSRWGKVAASATATQLINDFKVDEIIFTGVAGAISPTLNIGDIVIGDKLYQHDMDASPLYQKFEIPIHRKKYFSAKNNLRLVNACDKFLENYGKYINKFDATSFNIYKPKILKGAIASGDRFIASQSSIEELNNALPNAVCVEMEGAAVAQVCYEYEIPFSIIRIISDKANDNAAIDFPKFANTIAGNYALGIFKNYFKELN